LQTRRLWLLPWTVADLDDAIALWGSREVMALLGGPMSRAQIEARLANEIDSQAQHGLQYWRATADGKFVGCCGLKLTDVDGRPELETGFHFLPSTWGRGYASEAAAAVVEHAKVVRAATQLFAGHHPQNHASRKVLEKLGFSRIGEHFYPPTGLMHPWYRLRHSVPE